MENHRLLHSLDLFYFPSVSVQSDGYYYDRLIPSSLSPEWKIKTAEIHTCGDLCRLRRRVMMLIYEYLLLVHSTSLTNGTARNFR